MNALLMATVLAAPGGWTIREVCAPPRPVVKDASPTLVPTPYAAVRRRVEGGEFVVMLVKPPAAKLSPLPVRLGWTTLRCDDAPLGPGRYDCRAVNGRPTITPVEHWYDTTVPGVAGSRPFRRAGDVGFHSGHQCPACGASQFVVAGWDPGGTHRHTCGNCGTSWHH